MEEVKVENLLDSYDEQVEEVKEEKEYVAYKKVSDCTCEELCCCYLCCGL